MVDWSEVTESMLIYQTPSKSCTVYRGTYKKKPIVLKKLKFPSASEAQRADTEAKLQCSLDHPNICRLIAFRFQSRFEAVLMIESMDKDLHKEIESRRKLQKHWQEEQIMTHFKEMLSALTYAQEKGICHRDVKPLNIFMKKGKTYLADFGCAKQMEFQETSTVIGTPYFFSPEIKSSFEGIAQGLRPRSLYNPYKSDLYSLGLTLLNMLNLRLNEELLNLRTLPEMTKEVIRRAKASDGMKRMLTDMLMVDSGKRLDFVQFSNKYFAQKAEIPREIAPVVVSPSPDAVNLPDVTEEYQWLLYIFSTSAYYYVSVSYTFYCYFCGRQYAIELLNPYTVEYMYFCSQDCYGAYSGSARMGRCMECDQAFYLSTDWHASVQAPPAEISLSSLCSILCYQKLLQDLFPVFNAPSHEICIVCRCTFLPNTDWHSLCPQRNNPIAPLSSICSYSCYNQLKSEQRPKSAVPRSENAKALPLVDCPSVTGRCSNCRYSLRLSKECLGTIMAGKKVTHKFCDFCARKVIAKKECMRCRWI